jgi:hypothetical protein
MRVSEHLARPHAPGARRERRRISNSTYVVHLLAAHARGALAVERRVVDVERPCSDGSRRHAGARSAAFTRERTAQ